MVFPGIQPARIQSLNPNRPVPGRYVLYWMQQSQRARFNHALEYAVHRANRAGLGVVVGFALADDYPEANLRHYTFMLEGLRETREELAGRGIGMVVRRGAPPAVATALGREAALIVCDRGYLRHQRAWREQVARAAACPVVQVESDVLVPVETAAATAQIGARTLRPRIHRVLADYRIDLPSAPVNVATLSHGLETMAMDDIATVLNSLAIDRSVGAVSGFYRGGATEARRRFDAFVEHRLARYAANHNQPQTGDTSGLSAYLHFGQISALELVLALDRAGKPTPASQAFVEQLVVRRELACNFTHFTPDYDAYTCIPAWAGASLAAQVRAPRPHRYTARQLENAQTHDPYWNAAMREMACTGHMHTHMRMYWGKKILEWSPSPEEGFALSLALNNKYFLDGRDPNSYAGVAWIYGVHDRAWPSRPIFGKVRAMMASGLERKCDIKAYVDRVDRLCRGR